ncbi:MAG: exosortase/archaeosortase family protein, partial [Ilumatobacteraceae bacterium]
MPAVHVAIPRLRRQRVTALVQRTIPAAAFVWACLTLFGHAWRAAEAGSVVLALHLLGGGNAQHLGDRILVASPGGATFLTNIEPWCSSLAIVATFAAVAAVMPTAPRRRIRAFVVGAGIVVACNLMRMLATVLVGVWAGPGEIEPFHDGLATGFAVLFVLFALAAFVSILWPPRPASRRIGAATRSNDRPARANAGMSRRQALGAGLAALVVVEAVPQLTFADDRKPTFALDPTRLGTCTAGCANCRACLAHGANK